MQEGHARKSLHALRKVQGAYDSSVHWEFISTRETVQRGSNAPSTYVCLEPVQTTNVRAAPDQEAQERTQNFETGQTKERVTIKKN